MQSFRYVNFVQIFSFKTHSRSRVTQALLIFAVEGRSWCWREYILRFLARWAEL